MVDKSPGQTSIPIQPVDRPILCSPYGEPAEHWVYDLETVEAKRKEGRRPASYWFKVERAGTQEQLAMFAQEQSEELDMVNALRADIKRWRGLGYEGATQVTKQLINYWWRDDRPRRLFFCQLEAAETIIYLNEIRLSEKRTRFKPAFEDSFLQKLQDLPAESSLPPLTRMGCKMATGSGKTVVMAMLIAWAFCNRGKVPSDERFPSSVLAVCPNLTIKERLQVLRPDNHENYYDAFDLVPSRLRPLLQSGRVLITNWHWFLPESEHSEGGQTYTVVNKGPESPEAFARKRLGDLYGRGPILVLNDEAHHAWRPKPVATESGVSKEELQTATVWIDGLDMINQAVGIRFCVDLSATPFYIYGSGYLEGSPFPWLVSNFGLVDAIESGIVKIPRLPVSDTSGRPEPKYFHLWRHIVENLKAGERLPGKGRKPKPEVIWREAQPALNTLASQWIERFKYIQAASDEKDKTPPVLIIVCDNTNIAELFYRQISGEEEAEVVQKDREEGDDGGSQDGTGRQAKLPKMRKVHGEGKLFPEYFANSGSFQPTFRIDSKLLAKAESDEPGVTKEQAAEELRQVVATIGKRGSPGEHIRCVVSVMMLNEGWDANNVTHILGLRAFESQLLCEQVVGRGLRRMDYTPDPETGLLSEEYVDIYGVPFSLIPFKGRQAAAPAPEDKPKNHVRALPERKVYEIRFPIVEGYAFALKRNVITADVDAMEMLRIDVEAEPTAVFVKPRVGFEIGAASMSGPGEFEEQTRQAYYESTHPQTIEFEITRHVVSALVGDGANAPNIKGNPKLRLQSRHQLFPQVLQLVHMYVDRKVDFLGTHPCELGQEKYVQLVVERMLSAIQPDDSQGEAPLMPILNRYTPIGSTGEVDFKTTLHCIETKHSHINLVAAHTEAWEQAAALKLEQAAERGIAQFYARNYRMGFTLPYEFGGLSRHYEPDFLVRIANDTTVVLEIKGLETEEDRAKHQAARRWVSAVNNWGELGIWDFQVCKNPQQLLRDLEQLFPKTPRVTG